MPERPASIRRLAVGLLALALAGTALWLVSEVRYAARLEAQITGLESRLTEARVALDAYRARLGEVRGRVSGLRAEFESLDALLATDPAPPAAPTAEDRSAAR